MDEIHGDLHRKSMPLISGNYNFISPATVIKILKTSKEVDSIQDFKLIEILGKPYYQVYYTVLSEGGFIHRAQHKPLRTKIQLADALSGALCSPLTENEAIEIARIFMR